MEFKSLRNIESSFRQIRLFGIIFVAMCAVVVSVALISVFNFAEKQREKIYVLDNGKSLMLALSQDMSQNRPAEAREHVSRCLPDAAFPTCHVPTTTPTASSSRASQLLRTRI